jgi:hypothetical protein
MIYIKYPQTSLDTDADLVKWHATNPVNTRKWKNLKPYLNKHIWEPYKVNNKIQKCWYSEMPVPDHYAEDVEHFRPKASAEPLNSTQKEKIIKYIGYPVPESNSRGAYSWLEFNHLNYRIVTALTNRGGGKVESFPVLQGTNRLADPELPGEAPEYPLLLDPCDKHDASVLMVLPDGSISPIAAQAKPTLAQYADLTTHWHDAAFDFLRGWVSIVVYQLDFNAAIKGRKDAFEEVKKYIRRLERDVNLNLNEHIKDHLSDIKGRISMYATFALAGRCALLSYDPTQAISKSAGTVTEKLLRKLYDDLIDFESKLQ